MDGIWGEYAQGIRKTYLLEGVTGSGKTEVYMELISRMIEEGKQAIVLIPEIALTFQTVRRFYERFGDRVSVMHSRLSDGERYDQFVRARKRRIDVMIGPRSALFTPFSQIGVIIIDEEHEGAYKSETVPRYDAREGGCLPGVPERGFCYPGKCDAVCGDSISCEKRTSTAGIGWIGGSAGSPSGSISGGSEGRAESRETGAFSAGDCILPWMTD